MAVQAVPSQPVSFDTTEKSIRTMPDYTGLCRMRSIKRFVFRVSQPVPGGCQATPERPCDGDLANCGACGGLARPVHSPCNGLATGLQSCGKAGPCHRGQILWQVPNPIGSPLSRYPVRLPSASRAAGGVRRAAGGTRRGFRGAEFDAIEDRRQGGSQRRVEARRGCR